MQKIKITFGMIILVMLFSSLVVVASDTNTKEDYIELTIEEALVRAKLRSKQLKLQQKNIEYAKKNLESAYYDYKNTSEYAYEHANFNYSVKWAEREYARKVEPLWEEKIMYDLETQFDAILALEEKYELAQKQLIFQEQSTRDTVRKQQFGLESENNVKTKRTIRDTEIIEIGSLKQSINLEYKKLNDMIGGKNERYTLVKQNTFIPVNQKRSLEGYISYAISENPNIWLQEEVAKLRKGIIGANSLDGSGAPTYPEYQKSKIEYDRGLISVSVIKEETELKLKELYDSILEIEAEYEKSTLKQEEIKRQYEILKSKYHLGYIPVIVLDEAELEIEQMMVKVNNLIRQHNKLKTQFEKSYIMQLF